MLGILSKGKELVFLVLLFSETFCGGRVDLAIMCSDSGASLAMGPATFQASRVGDGAGGSGGGHQWLLPHLMRRHRGGVDSTSRTGAPRF